MSFIGQEPITGAYSVLDDITTSATATYNLQLNSVRILLLLRINYWFHSMVLFRNGSSFTISGSQITFSSALTSSDSIDFIIALGDVLSVGTPTDGSVATASISSVQMQRFKWYWKTTAHWWIKTVKIFFNWNYAHGYCS